MPESGDADGADVMAAGTKKRGEMGQWGRYEYVRGANCGLFPSLNTREMSTPTPSNTPRRMPQAMAEPRADLGPPGNKTMSMLGQEREQNLNLTHFVQLSSHPS